MSPRPLRVLTWHVHGSYLRSLAATGHQFLVPVRPGRPARYGGRGRGWPENLVEVDAEAVPGLELDVVLHQHPENWRRDRHELLSPTQQQAVPAVYVEHDPPQAHPTDTRHPVDDPTVTLVHVTAFNALMWDSGTTPTVVIDHGVPDPGVRWSGELPRGLVVVNHLARRGRRLGLDVFDRLRAQVPLDLVGMGSEELGGLGEVPVEELPAFAGRYRFLCNPIRYTSLGLAVCEALVLGLPVVGLATTEMVTAVPDGVAGVVDTREHVLVAAMRRLIDDHAEAARLSRCARDVGRTRFGLARFARAWDEVLRAAAARRPVGVTAPPVLAGPPTG